MTNPIHTQSAEAAQLAGSWRVDPDESHARFTAGTMAGLISVPGRFRTLAGTIEHDEGGTTGTLSIDAASIDTGNRLRDRHLRSSEFFGAARHPEVRYEVDSIEIDGADLSLDGELLVAGARIRLPLAAKLRHHGADMAEIVCRTQLDRLELGIRGARGMVPRMVELDIAVVLRRSR
jgi:polyisoprenoid-binding protein YceI